MHDLPPEGRLFMLAAATRPEAATTDAILQLTEQKLDWRLIGHLAEREKLVSILHRGLRRASAPVPSDVARALATRALVIEFRLGLLESSLVRVVEELASIGIPTLLLKGAALALTTYHSFRERPMGDLDVLVPPNRATDAWQHLRRSGWGREEERESEFHESYHHLQPLVDPARAATVVEIHRAALPPDCALRFPGNGPWDTARSISVGGAQALVPDDAYQLLHLCIHFAWSHGLRDGLARTTRDIGWLIDRGSVQWPAFVTLARESRATTCAYWSLRLAAHLSDARVPDDVLAELGPPRGPKTCEILERAYTMTALFRACPSMRAWEALWSAGIRPRKSGHGRARPWDVNDRYMELLHQERASLAARLAAHAAGSREWLRFGKLLLRHGAPRSTQA